MRPLNIKFRWSEITPYFDFNNEDEHRMPVRIWLIGTRERKKMKRSQDIYTTNS